MGSPKELGPPSTSPLQENLSPAPLCPANIPPPAPVHTAGDVLQALVSTSTVSTPVFKIFDFAKIEYRAVVLNTDGSAEVARLTDLDHVEKVRTTAREDR